MPDEDKKGACERIIHIGAAASAAGGGLAVVPGSDSLVIMPIQVFMVTQLAKVYGVSLSSALARSAAYATLGQILGRGSAKILAGWIPGLGNVIRAGVAFSITQAIGWAVVDQLETGEIS